MAEIFNQHQPIYIQLLDRFRGLIVSGTWEPGTKIDSVRNLALEYGVNPNTIQRALSELEREGLAYSERTTGRFITDDQTKIKELRRTLANSEALAFITKAKELRLSKEDTTDLVELLWEEPDAEATDSDKE